MQYVSIYAIFRRKYNKYLIDLSNISLHQITYFFSYFYFLLSYLFLRLLFFYFYFKFTLFFYIRIINNKMTRVILNIKEYKIIFMY